MDEITRDIRLAKLAWKLARPIFVAIAKFTKNTTIDDELVEFMDNLFDQSKNIEDTVRTVTDDKVSSKNS